MQSFRENENMSCAGRNNVAKNLEAVPKLGWEVEGGHGRKVTPGEECY